MSNEKTQPNGSKRRPIGANLFGLMCVAVGLAFACRYVAHLYKNYSKIENELREKSSRIINPNVDDESVSEIGYIFSMRREKNIGEGRLNLVWFVVVPSKNTRWSCSFQSGFSDFRTGDSVTIIHKKSDVDNLDYSGYLIGLHGKDRGRATDVWAIDLEELEMSVGN